MPRKKSPNISEPLWVQLFLKDKQLLEQDSLERGLSQSQIIRDIVHEYYFLKQDPCEAAREDKTIVSDKRIDVDTRFNNINNKII